MPIVNNKGMEMSSVGETVVAEVQVCKGGGGISGGNPGDDVDLLKRCEDLHRIAAQLMDADGKVECGEVAGVISRGLVEPSGRLDELCEAWDKAVSKIASTKSQFGAGIVAKTKVLAVCRSLEDSYKSRVDVLAQSLLDDYERLVAEPASRAE